MKSELEQVGMRVEFHMKKAYFRTEGAESAQSPTSFPLWFLGFTGERWSVPMLGPTGPPDNCPLSSRGPLRIIQKPKPHKHSYKSTSRSSIHDSPAYSFFRNHMNVEVLNEESSTRPMPRKSDNSMSEMKR